MAGALDVAALRASTPGAERGAHFNHAGASLPSAASLEAISGHLQAEALHGPMEAGVAAQGRLDDLRRDAAALLGARPDEIAFGPGGSALWGRVFAALPSLREGDRVLVGRQEWGGNLSSLHAVADRVGAVVEAIPCLEDGGVDADALARRIDKQVKLVSLVWLPANGGLINDAVAVGRVTRAAGVPYIIDAAQAVGQIEVDVEALGCDMLASAGRKHLRGPRGTGLLYVRRSFLPTLAPAFLDIQSAPYVDGGPRPRTDARLLEMSETSVALLLGLGVAIRDTLALGLPAIRARIRGLAEDLRAQLRDIPGVTLHDLGIEHSGLVSFNLRGISSVDLQAKLAEGGLFIGANGPAYTPLDMSARGLDGVARASVSYLHIDEELTRLAEAVRAIAKQAVR